MIEPDTGALWSFRLSMGLYALLLLSFCLWQLTREGGPVWLFWIIQVVPLLLPLPGLLRRRPRAFIWLGFLLLAYFVRGVEGVFAPGSDWIDYTMLTLSVLLFISATLASRWLHAANQPAPQA